MSCCEGYLQMSFSQRPLLVDLLLVPEQRLGRMIVEGARKEARRRAALALEVDVKSRREIFDGHPFREEECWTVRARFTEVLMVRIGPDVTALSSSVLYRD